MGMKDQNLPEVLLQVQLFLNGCAEVAKYYIIQV